MGLKQGQGVWKTVDGETYIGEWLVKSHNPLGSKANLMAMESIFGKMAIAMKANGKTDSNMEKEQMFLQVEICILANTVLENLQEKVHTSGRTGVYIKEGLKMALNMVKEDGSKIKISLTLITMKENI